MNPGDVAIVILAAGASRRLGHPKQLLVYEGQSLLRRAASAAIDAACGPVLAVVGHQAELIRRELLSLPVEVVENPQWPEGMSSSIRAGITRLNTAHPQASAAILMLCDQPKLSADVLRQMVEAYRRGHPVVACAYGETIGAPALFARPLWAELASLRGDRGAKPIIMAHRSEAAMIDFPEGAMDVDTPGDV